MYPACQLATMTTTSTPTRVDHESLAVLERLARSHPEVWHSTRRIAQAMGVAVRAAQLRLRRLISLGWLHRVLDYGLKTRRRLVLTARQDDTPEPENCAHETPEIALTNGTPPHPPIDGPDWQEEKETSNDDDSSRTRGRDGSSSSGESCSQGARARTRDGRPRATPEEVARLDTVAARVAPHDPGMRDWLRYQCRKWGLSWVLPAVETAARRAADDPIRNPRGFVAGTLRNWAEEGGPPPDPAEIEAARRKASAERWDRMLAEIDAEEAERSRRLYGSA